VENPIETIGQSFLDNTSEGDDKEVENEAMNANPVLETESPGAEVIPGQEDNLSQVASKPSGPSFTILDALSATGLRLYGMLMKFPSQHPSLQTICSQQRRKPFS